MTEWPYDVTLFEFSVDLCDRWRLPTFILYVIIDNYYFNFVNDSVDLVYDYGDRGTN